MSKKPRKLSAPPDETKADKFSRLASLRVTKAVAAIGLIGKLATRSYEYSPAQVSMIMKYLEEAIVEAKKKFSAPPGTTASVPTLKI